MQARGGDLFKLIWHDGHGACLFAKKLERGRFIWPTTQGDAVTLWAAQLGYLLERIDWRAPRTQRLELAGQTVRAIRHDNLSQRLNAISGSQKFAADYILIYITHHLKMTTRQYFEIR
jgi:hypothetical protein